MSFRAKILLPALGLSLIAACGDMAAPSPPAEPTVCVTAGQPCQLPDGPMGVCNESLSAQCETPPCLACISQH